jgi:type III secretion protein V
MFRDPLPLTGSLRLRPGRFPGDLFVVAIVVAVLALLVVPLPTWVLDFLLTANLSLAVALLMVSFYISTPLKISAFPSILLLTTLFRLALNVSSTRLILSEADAGEVIDAFGHFVVAGNYVVGVVIFLILTIIQFVVIAKGSERVSEVAARFALDAMPGKQMAIDADLRSGVLQVHEAGARRTTLQRESQLFGALDGAMKFVKGDAVAALIITAVNIVAGITIGVFQQEMSLLDSARVYVLLTVGDGIVCQIPALLIATAAGIIVTRVGGDEDEHLGGIILSQLRAHPNAFLFSGIIFVSLGFVPGLPLLPFGIWGLLLIGGGWVWTRKRQTLPEKVVGERRDNTFFEIVLAESAASKLGAGGLRAVRDGVSLISRRMVVEHGAWVPRIEIAVLAELSDFTVQVRLEGSVVDRCSLPGSGEAIVYCPSASLMQMEVASVPAPGRSTTLHANLVSSEDVGRVTDAGWSKIPMEVYLLDRVRAVVRLHLSECLGLEEVHGMLDELRRYRPAEVAAAVPSRLTALGFSRVLRALVREGVPIHPFRQVVRSVSEIAEDVDDPDLFVEKVRRRMARVISNRYAPEGELAAVVLDPAVERMVLGCVRERTGNLGMPPDVAAAIIEAVRSEVAPLSALGEPSVVVTEGRVRRHLRALLATDLAEVVVLSHEELEPHVEVKPIARVEAGASA